MKESKKEWNVFERIKLCFYLCMNVISSIHYYKVTEKYEEIEDEIKPIVYDMAYAYFGSIILASYDLLNDKKSAVNIFKIKNLVHSKRRENKLYDSIDNQINKWIKIYDESEEFKTLNAQIGLAYLRDKVVAHTDLQGIFKIHDHKEIMIITLEKVIKDLYELYRMNLSELTSLYPKWMWIIKETPSVASFNKECEKKYNLLLSLLKNK